MSGGLWSLFFGSFLAATLLPGGSELLLVTLALRGEAPLALLGVATLGNTLGGMSSWLIGYLLAHRAAPMPTRPRHTRALGYLRRWGALALLGSWIPLIGDPLCVAAGWLGISPWRSLLAIASGKAARYAALLAALPGS